MKKDDKVLICVIIVLACLLIAFGIIEFQNNSKYSSVTNHDNDNALLESPKTDSNQIETNDEQFSKYIVESTDKVLSKKQDIILNNNQDAVLVKAILSEEEYEKSINYEAYLNDTKIDDINIVGNEIEYNSNDTLDSSTFLFNIKKIKGKDNKDYLFLKIDIYSDYYAKTKMFILNENRKVLFEYDEVITSEILDVNPINNKYVINDNNCDMHRHHEWACNENYYSSFYVEDDKFVFLNSTIDSIDYPTYGSEAYDEGYSIIDATEKIVTIDNDKAYITDGDKYTLKAGISGEGYSCPTYKIY